MQHSSRFFVFVQISTKGTGQIEGSNRTQSVRACRNMSELTWRNMTEHEATFDKPLESSADFLYASGIIWLYGLRVTFVMASTWAIGTKFAASCRCRGHASESCQESVLEWVHVSPWLHESKVWLHFAMLQRLKSPVLCLVCSILICNAFSELQEPFHERPPSVQFVSTYIISLCLSLSLYLYLFI